MAGERYSSPFGRLEGCSISFVRTPGILSFTMSPVTIMAITIIIATITEFTY